MTAMAHLTCACHSRSELAEIVERYGEHGIENILALGGDPPQDLGLPDRASCRTRSTSCASSARWATSPIGVAVHPEPHPKSPSVDADRAAHGREARGGRLRDHAVLLRRRHYFDLVDSLRRLGVDKPMVAGIMPATRLSSIERMSAMQGSEFPQWLREKLEAVGDDPKAVRAVGVDEATKLCRTLLDGGAPGLHFYTLNRSTATREIYQALGLTSAR